MKGLITIASLVHGTQSAETQVNPIRKVVNMLQLMQSKIEKQAEKKEAVYDKFMCYCENSDKFLGSSIAAAENKIPQLQSGIKSQIAEKAQLEADLTAHKSDRAAAKGAIAKATSLRAKDAASFLKESTDLQTNIDALGKAIPALEKGMGGGFLQTSAASVIRELSISMDMSSVDRELLASFLSNKNGYIPQGGEIVGILKTMSDEMKKDLATAKSNEKSAISDFNGLVAAKAKEINALSKAIESKTGRVGALAVKSSEDENELEDTQEDLAESQKFLADLSGNCATKKSEWAEYQKTQADESLALAETIKVLNDDDALELFKKTLPAGSSLLQVQVTSAGQRQVAINALKKSSDPRVELLAVALKGGKQGFDKIVKLISDLVVTLKKEQADDDQKKTYCGAQIDKTEDSIKVIKNGKADLDTAIEAEEEAIASLKTEIGSLTDGIASLDKEVADYTGQRKAEHEDFVSTLSANSAAVDLLKFAKNRLQKFYNPKLHKAAPARVLSEEDQITENFGGALAPAPPPGGIAGTGISFVQLRNAGDAAPPPAPEADLAYKTKAADSNGVLTMLDTIINDVEKENQIMDLTEKDSQKDYEKFMSDAQGKRAADASSLNNRKGALASTKSQLLSDQDSLKAANTNQMNTEKGLAALHGECDWLLKYFDIRMEARTGEIDSLAKAKDVLNGASFS